MLGREIISDIASAFELGNHGWFFKAWSVSSGPTLVLRAKFMPNHLTLHSVVGWMKQKTHIFLFNMIVLLQRPTLEDLYLFDGAV